MMKRIAALLLAFIFVCGLQATAKSPFTDIADENCITDVEFLYSLGIVEGKNAKEFMPADILTRAEMVIILLRTMGINEPRNSYLVFEDVPDDHWAFYEIGYAHSIGMINGVSEKLFAPDEPVTYNQAIKMIISVLGYDFMANAKGGYPAGYQYAAHQLELLDGLSGGAYGENPISRGDMAILVANALKTEVAEVYAIGSGSGQTESHLEKGKMLMSLYLDIKKIEGVVNAHYFSSVSGNLPENTDEVIIGETLLRAGNSDVLSRLGENVIAYVKDEGNGAVPTIIYSERARGTEVSEFTANDVENVTHDKIVYKLDGKKKNLNITNVDLYVNGIETVSLSGKDLSSASYKFIENANRRLLLVDAYTDAVVKSASAALQMLYLEENTAIDLEDYDKFILKDAEGRDLTLADVKAWDIVSYRNNSRNGESIFYGIVVNTTAEGELVSKGESGNYTELQVGELPYKVSTSLFGEIPDLGTKVKVYTNYLGHIAAINTDVAEYTYGYLVAAGRESTFANVQFKVFTSEGKMELFSSRDRVDVNGTPVENNDLTAQTAIFPDGTSAKKQLIRYEVSKAGEIMSIETASDSVVASSDRKVFGRNFYAESSGDGRWMNVFAAKYTVDNNTVYFTIPTDADAEDKDYKVTSITTLKGFDSYVNPAYFYDIDEDNVIGVICKEYSTQAGSSFNMAGSDIKYGVVTGKKYVRHEDDYYPTLSITTSTVGQATDILIDESDAPIKMGTKTSANVGSVVITNSSDPYYGKDTIKYEDVSIGDILIFQVDSDGVAYDAQILVRANYPSKFESNYDENPGENYSGLKYYRWASSTVDHISDNGIIGDVNIYNGGPYERLFLKSNVLIYDSKLNEVTDGAWEDIQETDRFGLAHWSIYASFVVVYR